MLLAPARIALRGLHVASLAEVWVAGYAGTAGTVARLRNGTRTTR
jgi:hypothetical protein